MNIVLLCAVTWASPIDTWDFDMSGEEFTPDTRLQWQWGTDDEGRTGWATRLNSLYLNDAVDRLTFPNIDLTGTTRPVLGLAHSYNIDPSGPGDSGWLEAMVDGEWTVIEPVYGYPYEDGFTDNSNGEQTDWFDLSGLGPAPALRLVFHSDPAIRRSGWFIDAISIEDGDPVPPHFVSVTELTSTDDVVGPYAVTAQVIDDQALTDVSIYWRTNDGASQSAPMLPDIGDQYVGLIEGQTPGTVVEWWIEASDGLNTARWPELGEGRFTVSLPVPYDLIINPEPLHEWIADTELDLQWTPPASPYTILGYQVERDGVRIASPDDAQTTIDLVDGIQLITVRARFTTDAGIFTSEPSDPLPLQVALPRVSEMSPQDAWPGDDLRVMLSGSNLYLDGAHTVLEPGPGIAIETFEVLDAHSARALIHVDADAEPGPRVFEFHTGDTTILVDPVFIVRGEGDRPMVLGAHPSTVRQGANTTVFIDMSAPADVTQPPPIVRLGEGIIVETVTRRGSGLDVSLSVAHDAPLGAHPIEIDEEDRLITGATITVRDTPKVPSRNCSVYPQRSGQSWIWIAGILIWARQRWKH